jgi:hypothetical protein
MEGKKAYFFKQSNKLFIAWDKQTATRLVEISAVKLIAD